MAPIGKGETVGRVNVELEGELIASVPLVALDAVAQGGLLQQAKDTVLLWFE
jgi:D-alanyl-D-alanine carboxypeptidase (penicillin-binding protein 5/6)